LPIPLPTGARKLMASQVRQLSGPMKKPVSPERAS